jgi:glycosyltransferase involved in cell wall biosynthesis
MRILHTVEFYSPSIGGAQEVIRQISEHLVRRGHEVTVATKMLSNRKDRINNGVKIVEFNIQGNFVTGIKGDIEKYQQFLLSSKFDLLLSYAAQQWATDLTFPLLKQLQYPAILVPCGFSGLHDPQYKIYFENLARILLDFKALVFHAEDYRDIRFARQVGHPNICFIPNGAAEDEFIVPQLAFRSKYSIPSNIPLFLTVGTHTGIKGHRLVMDSFRKSKIKDGILLIIGNRMENSRGCYWKCILQSRFINLASFGSKQVWMINPPRQEVISAYQTADLFLFGSNIEYSPLVLFECMASRTPYISLACGNAQEIQSWGNSGIIVPTNESSTGYVDGDPRIFAQAIDQLWADQKSRLEMAESGYRIWKEKFTWDIITDHYENLYKRILEQ